MVSFNKFFLVHCWHKIRLSIAEPWEDAERKITATPLPERTRNIPPPLMSNNERPSNTLTSLLDRRESVNSENKNDKKDVSW